MTTTVNAYLGFNGKCREAMNFYQQCLGGELALQPVEGTPMEAQCPSSMKHQILHSSLTKGTLVILATDMVHEEHVHGNNVSLCVNCSSEVEIRAYFSAVQVGGRVIDPLGERFWGATFGALIDKYGVRWMFNFDSPQN